MPQILQVDDLRALGVRSSLEDSALEEMIEAEEEEIESRYGSLSSRSWVSTVPGMSWITPPSSGISVSSVTLVGFDGTRTPLVEGSDYAMGLGGMLHIPSGVAYQVEVEYQPEQDLSRRRLAIVDLVKLRLAFRGVDSFSLGDLSENMGDYSEKRERILRSLAPRRGGIVIA